MQPPLLLDSSVHSVIIIIILDLSLSSSHPDVEPRRFSYNPGLFCLHPLTATLYPSCAGSVWRDFPNLLDLFWEGHKKAPWKDIHLIFFYVGLFLIYFPKQASM